MSGVYTLYGWDHSLFTGKIPPYLRYKGLAFKQRIATPQIFEKVIVPRVGAPIIPVLGTPDGDIVQDTTEIIDFLELRHPQASVYPNGARQKLVALMLEHYGDEWLVIPAMHYRWSCLDEQREFIAREFGRAHAPDEAPQNQIRIGEELFSNYLPFNAAVGVTEQTIPAIESAYTEFLTQLNDHFKICPFLLGTRPSIGDYGFMAPLYAHLGRDPVPKALMQSVAPEVYRWVERMNQPQPLTGDFLADDEIPDTLIPILKTLCRDFLPDVMDVIQRNTAWIDENPGHSVPRFHGMHPFSIGACTGERFVHSYSQWMFQRAWSHYHKLTDTDRDAADELLERVGGLGALQVELPYQLRREPGQLELVLDESKH